MLSESKKIHGFKSNYVVFVEPPFDGVKLKSFQVCLTFLLVFFAGLELVCGHRFLNFAASPISV